MSVELLHVSSIRDHRKNNKHLLAMLLLAKKMQPSMANDLQPMLQLYKLAFTRLSDREKARLKCNFDIRSVPCSDRKYVILEIPSYL